MSVQAWDDTIRDFVRRAASASPTPGGGSVAALVAALGAAMISMTGNLTAGAKYAGVEAEMAAAVAEMTRLAAECERLQAADMRSFDAYMRAVKLPKQSEEEKRIRDGAIRAAVREAIDVPLRLIEACAAGMQCAIRIAHAANKHVVSDLGIGAVLLEAAAQSARLTVEMNLASLQDPDAKRRYADATDRAMRRVAAQREEALAIVRSRMAR